MYFKFHNSFDKFSWILYKNPNSEPYKEESEEFSYIGKFLDDNTYEIISDIEPIYFLDTVKKMNKDVYLNPDYSCAAPFNMRSVFNTLRSAIIGKWEKSSLTQEEYFHKSLDQHIIIGPVNNDDKEFFTDLFNNFYINVEIDSSDKLETRSSFMFKLSPIKEMSITEFLQKTYVLITFLCINKNSLYRVDENIMYKIINISKEWLTEYNSDEQLDENKRSKYFNMIMNKFCHNNFQLKKKFKEEFGFVEPLSNLLEKQINKKISLHEMRHNIILNKIDELNGDINTIVDFCTSEGKLLENIVSKYNNKKILGIESDFRKIQKMSSHQNINMLESNILYPNITKSDTLPDLLTCVEAIEHFNKEDRIKILTYIKDLFVPKYFYLTTPNVEFNKFYNMPEGSYRRRDHHIEYTEEQFKEEIIDFLSDTYDVELINIIDPIEEFENKQPSFCIFCTHKSASITYKTISKLYPKKNETDEEKTFTITITNEWTDEQIEEWKNNLDFRKPRINKYKRKVDYKLLRELERHHGHIYLPISNERVTNFDLNKGYTTRHFMENHNKLIYLAPTVSPVETLRSTSVLPNKLDEYYEKFGKFDEYIEHPLSAYLYYKERGIEELIQQTKYMGSRVQLIWFRDLEKASAYGLNSTVTINSRNGYSVFEDRDSEYKDIIYNDILKNIDVLEIHTKMNIDYIILDCELLPWTYFSEKLLNEQFFASIESYYLNSIYKNKNINNIDLILNTLKNFTQNTNIELRPFHVLAIGSMNDRNYLHGYNMSNLNMMKYIEILSQNSNVIKECEYRIIKNEIDISNNIKCWEHNCTFTEKDFKEGRQLLEGYVYKPLNHFASFNKSGYYIQPALKVRGKNYLNLTYGIDLYENEKYFKMVSNRFVSKKRNQAIQQFECSKYILDAFLHKQHPERIKYIAAFFGMDTHTSIDRTL